MARTSSALQKASFCSISQMTKRLANTTNAALTGVFVPLRLGPQHLVDLVGQLHRQGVHLKKA